MVWILFKGVNRFLTGGSSMTQNEDLDSWINLGFQIYYKVVCLSKFL
jgi:hypothetical protein